ncbi:MAG: transposase [Anaerolineae bacterium]
MVKKPVRVRIRRVYVDEGVYFITFVTRNRYPIFADATEIERLRETMRQVKDLHPFTMHGYVFLPDHAHLQMRVGETTDISKVMHSIKRNYTLNYKKARGINGRVTHWQPGFWDHVIRDERDYKNHLDYIHHNPVKHGYVTRPEDYPHSSYMEYVRRGWYEIGWGHTEPDILTDLDTSEP